MVVLLWFGFLKMPVGIGLIDTDGCLIADEVVGAKVGVFFVAVICCGASGGARVVDCSLRVGRLDFPAARGFAGFFATLAYDCFDP